MAPVEEITGGWDSRAYLVDGTWLDREPRRPGAAEALRTETRLLPWLAPQLPLPVPLPVVLRGDPLRVRHRLVPGEPVTAVTGPQGIALGRFFHVLHAVNARGAVARGVADAARAHHELGGQLRRFRDDVLPRLPAGERDAGAGLLDRLARPAPATCLVHGDVGPAHLLVVGDRVSGVIDWGDARIGDPALDLAWLTHGSGAAAAVAAGYGAGPGLLARARDWHLLGPWHEVTYGLDTDQPEFVDSGMDGVRTRLNSGQ